MLLGAAMVGYKARTVLMKTAWANWAISVGLVIWHIIPDGPKIDDPDGTLIALFLVLAVSGTIIATIRQDSGPKVDKFIGEFVDRLVDAFLASRPGGGEPEPLRLVGPEETGSTIPVPRRSVL